MTQPNIALIEATQALRESWDLVKSGNFLHSTVADQMHNLLGPMTQTLANLDSKDKSSSATSQDVYELMRWCFKQPELDGLHSTWMEQSAAFFVLLSQMGAIRICKSMPNKLVSDGPEAVQFRRDKTVGAMQQMLARPLHQQQLPPQTSVCVYWQPNLSICNNPLNVLAFAHPPQELTACKILQHRLPFRALLVKILGRLL